MDRQSLPHSATSRCSLRMKDRIDVGVAYLKLLVEWHNDFISARERINGVGQGFRLRAMLCLSKSPRFQKNPRRRNRKPGFQVLWAHGGYLRRRGGVVRMRRRRPNLPAPSKRRVDMPGTECCNRPAFRLRNAICSARLLGLARRTSTSSAGSARSYTGTARRSGSWPVQLDPGLVQICVESEEHIWICGAGSTLLVGNRKDRFHARARHIGQPIISIP